MKKIATYISDFTKKINDSNVGTYSASAAYYCILSSFPIIILIANILPLTNISSDYLFNVLDEILPNYILNIVHDIFFEFSSIRGALISFTAIMIIWSAGNGVWALMNGLNSVNEVEEKRNWFIVHFISIFYMAIFITIFIFYLLFMVFGNRIKDIVFSFNPRIKVFYTVILKFRFFISLIILVIVLMFMYRTLTSLRVHLLAQFPGALFSSISWSLISFGFSKYVDYFSTSGFYGSFTIIIFSFLWVYWSIYFIFIGAIINNFWAAYFDKKYLEKHYAKTRRQHHKAILKKLKMGIISEEEYKEIMELSCSSEAHSGNNE